MTIREGWQARLATEYQDLAGRLVALEKFVATECFTELPEIEQTDLTTQLYYMRELHTVLFRRAARHCSITVVSNA